MATANEIKWVKNIKREKGAKWAHMEETDDEIKLHFSVKKKASAKTVKVGEIMLLFQKVDKMPGVPKRTYLTHLVTPIDEVSYPSENDKFPVYRRMQVIAKGNKENSPYSNPSQLNFFKPNRGAVHNIGQLNEAWSIAQIQDEVWSLFQGRFI